jgi:mRNA interferase MazF
MERGEVWWARMPVPRGSGPGYRRPLLVVQADAFNRSRISTVLCVALTSNLALAEAPGNVRLSKRTTRLPKASVADVSQVVTLDRSFLTKRVAKLPERTLRQIDSGLRLALGL